jgi:3-isopropylmalate/(R)-2-methylmalate dehydratase large subunit
MNMTLAEKILAKKSARQSVKPGEILECTVDMAMSHDATVRVIPPFREMGGTKVWDKDRIVVLIDHWVPADSEESASSQEAIRNFAFEQDLPFFYDVKEGTCHQVLPEKGHVLPGQLIIGTDSHTTTYGAFGAFATGVGPTDMAAIYLEGKTWLKVPETIKIIVNGKLGPLIMGKDLILFLLGRLGTDFANYRAMEFCGESIVGLSMDSRMTMCNMGIEMGAKAAMIVPDNKTYSYLNSINRNGFESVFPDEGAVYAETLEFDVSGLKPQVAGPFSPDNVKNVDELAGIKINQVYLGSCTNGRLEDLEMAYRIIKGKKIPKHVRMYISPASRGIYLQSSKLGYLEAFVEAGAVILNPSCGACFGGQMGLLAPGEVCVATTNRNYRGRMGSVESQVYLASPATAAACAVAGEITNPEVWM